MIRPLRRAHLAATALLALSLPIVLGSALSDRQGRAIDLDEAEPGKSGMESVVSVKPANPGKPTASSSAETDSDPRPAEDLGPAVEGWLGPVRWQRGANGATFLKVHLEPLPQAPALLLYRSAVTGTVPQPGSPLPSDAVFLGALGTEGGLGSGPRRFVSVAASGTLVLYSLGHGEVVSATPLLRPSDRSDRSDRSEGAL